MKKKAKNFQKKNLEGLINEIKDNKIKNGLLINKIQKKIRSRNNKNWMDLLGCL